MSYDNQRAAKGQAINLAIMTAIADGKQHDNKYIIEQFLRHLQFAAMMQKATPDQLATAVDNPKFISLIQDLDKELNKNV